MGLLSGLVGVAGSILDRNSAKSSANALSSAARQQQALSQKAYNLYNPYATAGTSALSQYQNMLNTGGVIDWEKQYENSALAQSQLDAGLKAVQNSAAAGGNLHSGAALQALQTTGQNLASQNYNNWYNKQMQGYSNLMNQGMSAAGNQANSLYNQQEIVGTLGNINAQKATANNNMYSNILGSLGSFF